MIRRDARPFALASVALAIAGLVTATPVAAPPDVRLPGPAVQLTAGDNVLNIPLNLLTDLVNIGYNEVQAIQQMEAALEFSGNWFVPSVTNVWGWDDGDWTRAQATVNMLLPFPKLSDPLGLDVAVNSAAETPTAVTCASVLCILNFGPGGIWAGFNQVSPLELADGYTFGTVPNPFYPVGADDHPGMDMENMLWSGQTYTVNFAQPFADFFDSLTADPSDNPIQILNPVDLVNALGGLLPVLLNSFFPFVGDSFFADTTYWNPIDGPLNQSPDVAPGDAAQALDALSTPDLPL